MTEDRECPSCKGLGDIYTKGSVPWLDRDQPCGTCFGLGVVEFISYNGVFQSGIEEE